MNARTLFRTGALLLLVSSATASAARAQSDDVFYEARLADLISGTEADADALAGSWVSIPSGLSVRLDGEGEAWVFADPGRFTSSTPDEALLACSIAVRAERAEAVQGRVFIASGGGRTTSIYRFTLGPEHIVESARESFLRAKADHFRELRSEGGAGAAWFRHREREARRELGEEADERETNPRGVQLGELDETYELFSGGRAVSENLQLDRVWEGTDGGDPKLPIAEMEGIEVREFDWTERVAGLEPELDPLASWVPADQHAVFFPSFQAMLYVLDESLELGTPLGAFLDPRAEDSRTRERYETQLCLELNQVTRVLGSAVVESIVLTGSDPYLRTGTDVALVFECSEANAFFAAVEANQSAAAERAPSAVALDRAAMLVELGLPDDAEVSASGLGTVNRELSSYVVQQGDTVVVANSLAQLERVLAAQSGALPALAGSAEFRFFRDRYPRATNDEVAFLMLTDATIRRWCGPRWRIGAARRLRAAALLSELQAELLPALVRGEAAELPALDDSYAPLGELSISGRGVRSAIYGDLAFQTPILELELELASRSEASAYKRFQRRYQREWRTYFDPIALQFQRTETRIGFDLTVMPLIDQSTYSRLIDLTGDVQLEPSSGDPHPEALWHYVMALSTDGQTFNMGRGMAGMFMPGVEDPFSWIGKSAALYVDADPLWFEMLESNDRNRFVEQNLSRLPIGLHIGVTKPLLLAAFLTSLRGFADQSAPDVTVWENHEYNGRTYVSVGSAEEFESEPYSDLRVHYVALPSGLTVSLSEAVVKRAIDRHQARTNPDAEVAETPDWLGKSAAMTVSQESFRTLIPLWDGSELDTQLQRQSFSNLPILNEWKRLFPERDPVEVHEEVWFTRLVCPSGGEYVWNESARTMMSTVYGYPGASQPGSGLPDLVRQLRSLDFGMSFEDGGMRAKTVVVRQK